MTDIYGYAAAAPLYRAAGWMQVIPLPEGRKTPPPSGFTGRSRKPVTDEQVQVWSQATPDANTGIVIPEGVLVLDIDAGQGHRVKADGAKGISELSQELGALPATWSSTAHGIDSARIVQEERSRTTRENLENSFAILRARGYDPANGVGIVTSEYHLYRAKRMVRALGAEPVGIAAETTLPTMRVNYFIREAFAAAYMQLAGTLY